MARIAKAFKDDMRDYNRGFKMTPGKLSQSEADDILENLDHQQKFLLVLYLADHFDGEFHDDGGDRRGVTTDAEGYLKVSR